jgi:hypothetical protein
MGRVNTVSAPRQLPSGAGPLVDCVLEVARRLSLVDGLSAGALSAEDLARATGTHGPSLYRLLRVLACVRVVDEIEPGVFARTPAGRAEPRPDAAALPPLPPLPPLFGAGSLLYAVRTGQPAFRAVFGQPVFDYIASDPAASAALATFTAGATERAAPAIVDAADFARFATVVDVGGGAGTLVKHILSACVSVHGVVFDTAASGPAAVRELTSVPELAGRWEVRAGDFFDHVPPGGDAYVLKSVLHDWDEAAAARILRNCRAAMTPAARLLIFEPVLPRAAAWSPAHLPAVFSDMICLVMSDGGRERTEAEFRALLAAAGLQTVAVSPVPGSAHFHKVEAVRGDT